MVTKTPAERLKEPTSTQLFGKVVCTDAVYNRGRIRVMLRFDVELRMDQMRFIKRRIQHFRSIDAVLASANNTVVEVIFKREYSRDTLDSLDNARRSTDTLRRDIVKWFDLNPNEIPVTPTFSAIQRPTDADGRPISPRTTGMGASFSNRADNGNNPRH